MIQLRAMRSSAYWAAGLTLLLAVGAAAGDGEAVGVDREAVLAPSDPDEVGEDVVGDLDHGAALLADKVAVGGGGEVAGGRAAAQPGAGDDAEPLEFFKVVVDGGQVHVGARTWTSAASSSALRCSRLSNRAFSSSGPLLDPARRLRKGDIVRSHSVITVSHSPGCESSRQAQ